MGKLRNLKLRGLSRTIQQLVRTAELLHPGEKTGEEKRAWVVSLLNKRVDIPFLNEDQESIIIGALVDLAVDAWQDAKDKWGDG
jgi:hypothetical protein